MASKSRSRASVSSSPILRAKDVMCFGVKMRSNCSRVSSDTSKAKSGYCEMIDSSTVGGVLDLVTVGSELIESYEPCPTTPENAPEADGADSTDGRSCIAELQMKWA